MSVFSGAQLHSTASNLSKDAIIYNTTATGKLNDTGIVLYGTPSTANSQSNSLEATDSNAATPAQQDAAHGRDAQAQAGTLAKVGSSSTNGGKANGFDFTKMKLLFSSVGLLTGMHIRLMFGFALRLPKLLFKITI